MIEELEDSNRDVNTPFHTRTMRLGVNYKVRDTKGQKKTKDEYDDEFDDDEWEEWG